MCCGCVQFLDSVALLPLSHKLRLPNLSDAAVALELHMQVGYKKYLDIACCFFFKNLAFAAGLDGRLFP